MLFYERCLWLYFLRQTDSCCLSKKEYLFEREPKEKVKSQIRLVKYQITPFFYIGLWIWQQGEAAGANSSTLLQRTQFLLSCWKSPFRKPRLPGLEGSAETKDGANNQFPGKIRGDVANQLICAHGAGVRGCEAVWGRRPLQKMHFLLFLCQVNWKRLFYPTNGGT